MSNVTREQSELTKEMIVNSAAKSFLEKGFTNTTVRNITSRIGISTGAFNSHFRTKEDVLCELVSLVLNQQFAVTENLLKDKTNDKLLIYAAETALQLHIVEMNENLRDVYSSAYSLPKTSAIIQQTVTGKLEDIFKEYLPTLETKDFYLLEIATGGIMRGFMTVPCNMWFSMDMKIVAFLKSVLRLYSISNEKIDEAITFVKGFDFDAIAKQTVDGIFKFLDNQMKNLQ
ncbi:MAG: TetR/AcrR family transcriptional regulator [Clostridiales bacterium]|nr:TetR/AcrR family transcriptional regulator [Clostridiales bacterium]